MAKSEHVWQDDALRPGGRAWMAGVRFVCAQCPTEKRVMRTGDGESQGTLFVVKGEDGTMYRWKKGAQPPCQSN